MQLCIIIAYYQVTGTKLYTSDASRISKVGLDGTMALENGAHITKCGFNDFCQLTVH